MKQYKVFGLCIVCLLSAACAFADSAKEILDATGVKGGLIVHIGCGDAGLVAGLRVNDSYLVHGLDTSVEKVKKVRKTIKSKGLYGKVSVDTFDGKRLLYADNLVSLLVIRDEEIERVLAPRGVALIQGNLKPEFRRT